MNLETLLVFRWQDIIDITIVAIIIYQLLLWTKNRNASKLLQGVFIVLIFYSISHFLQLYTIDWLMQKLAMIMLFVFLLYFSLNLDSF